MALGSKPDPTRAMSPTSMASTTGSGGSKRPKKAIDPARVTMLLNGLGPQTSVGPTSPSPSITSFRSNESAQNYPPSVTSKESSNSSNGKTSSQRVRVVGLDGSGSRPRSFSGSSTVIATKDNEPKKPQDTSLSTLDLPSTNQVSESRPTTNTLLTSSTSSSDVKQPHPLTRKGSRLRLIGEKLPWRRRKHQRTDTASTSISTSDFSLSHDDSMSTTESPLRTPTSSIFPTFINPDEKQVDLMDPIDSDSEDATPPSSPRRKGGNVSKLAKFMGADLSPSFTPITTSPNARRLPKITTELHPKDAAAPPEESDLADGACTTTSGAHLTPSDLRGSVSTLGDIHRFDPNDEFSSWGEIRDSWRVSTPSPITFSPPTPIATRPVQTQESPTDSSDNDRLSPVDESSDQERGPADDIVDDGETRPPSRSDTPSSEPRSPTPTPKSHSVPPEATDARSETPQFTPRHLRRGSMMSFMSTSDMHTGARPETPFGLGCGFGAESNTSINKPHFGDEDIIIVARSTPEPSMKLWTGEWNSDLSDVINALRRL
ncbi:hypothetical protein CC2G_001672 [Coprinopsis cinerea AmutBmut pab1-1]|nr:hypothetical protein CC2G_001672 [Coprinopsis cinerea AmutBmut pab1-1]